MKLSNQQIDAITRRINEACDALQEAKNEKLRKERAAASKEYAKLLAPYKRRFKDVNDVARYIANADMRLKIEDSYYYRRDAARDFIDSLILSDCADLNKALDEFISKLKV